jgi:hypothetical protein
MTRRILTLVAAAALLVVLLPVAAMAGNGNGQAIGQNDARLALTKCSNAGLGNGGEHEVGLLGFIVLKSDCLEKHGFFATYSHAELEAIGEQGTCDWVFFVKYCEIDPGNSAAHNANNN